MHQHNLVYKSSIYRKFNSYLCMNIINLLYFWLLQLVGQWQVWQSIFRVIRFYFTQQKGENGRIIYTEKSGQDYF